jgi:hypothetical protein
MSEDFDDEDPDSEAEHWAEKAETIIVTSLPPGDIERESESNRESRVRTRKSIRLRDRIARALRDAYWDGYAAGQNDNDGGGG